MSDNDDVFAAQMAAIGFATPDLPAGQPTSGALEAADRASRYWISTHAGALPLGSQAHKHEVCRMFRETFNPYRPSLIAWPKLSPELLQRVTSLRIWDIAVHTGGRGRLRLASSAHAVANPAVRAPPLLNACNA